MLEIGFWEPNEKGEIHRSGSIPDTVIGISRFQQVVLHQGRIEHWMSDAIRKWSGGSMKIERSKLPIEMTIEDADANDTEAYPVKVKVKTLAETEAQPDQFGQKVANGLFRQFDGEADTSNEEGDIEVINAKYVIGCDGAHSWTRKQLGIEMEGESTDYIWGVMDAVPITNFPDIRKRCAIHSANSGSIMIIPREQGLVRLYIQLKETPRGEANGRIDRSKITPELILENARKIFYPYTLDMIDVKWFTAYQIGQRVSPQFQKNNRVFIAGDACHTHSPKAGQGMNVSMMDTYNLGWKIAHVLKGLAKPEILTTYEEERRQIARDLINFDYKFSRLFSGKPADKSGNDNEGVSLEEFHRVFEKGNEFASGTIVDYEPSMLVKKPVSNIITDTIGKDDNGSNLAFEFREKFTNPLASNVCIGQRLDSAKIVYHSDAKPIHLADRLLSDGRYRILFFTPGPKHPNSYMKKFGDYLARPDSFVKQHTPESAHISSVIDTVLIHPNKREEIEWDEFPMAFRSRDEDGRMDYWSIFADEPSYHKGHGKIFEKFGIDPEKGAFIVTRPDGYVSLVTETSDAGVKEIEQFFDGCMTKLQKSWATEGGFVSSGKKIADLYGDNDTGFPIFAV